MKKVRFNETEFDIDTRTGCFEARDIVQKQLCLEEENKENLETRLSIKPIDGACIDYDESAQQELEKAEAKIRRLRGWLKTLDEQYASLLAREDLENAQMALDRAEERSEKVSKILDTVFPALARKMMLLAGIARVEQEERKETIQQAKDAGIEDIRILSPLQHILGEHFYPWADHLGKNLRIPLLDKDMEYLNYWPLPKGEALDIANPEIQDQIEQVLSADDFTKALKAVYREIDKMDVVIRKAEARPKSYLRSAHHRAWYEYPRSEWPDRLRGQSITEALNRIGDRVEFWLSLEEGGRLNSFIHLLEPDQRERALEHLPESERQRYQGHLQTYQRNQTKSKPLSRLDKFNPDFAEEDLDDDHSDSIKAAG